MAARVLRCLVPVYPWEGAYLLRSSLVAISISLSSLFIACAAPEGGAAEQTPADAPPPSDPIVFEASAETKADVGIAKWGYGASDEPGLSTFRGYGAKNELLVEIRQSLAETEPGTTRLSVTLSGPKAEAKQTIDLSERPTEDGSSIELALTLIESTITEGSVAHRVLDHLGNDGAVEGEDGRMTTPSASLTQKTLSTSQLVSTCNPLVECKQQLLDQAAADAYGRKTCTLINIFLWPLVKTVATAIATAGAGTVPAAVKNVAWPVAKCAYAVYQGKQADQAVKDCKAQCK